MRIAVRNAAFNLGGQLLPMLVALVAMPLLVAHAGPDRLGFLGLAWALIGYFALLDLGLSRVVTRRIAVADGVGSLSGEMRILKRLCLQLFGVVAAISAVLAFVVPASAIVGKAADPIVVDEARGALLILWATLPLTVVTGLLRGALEGLQQFGRVNLLRAFFGTWSFAAPLAMLTWSNALGPLTLAIAVGRVLSLVAHAYWAFAALRAHEAARRSGMADLSAAPVPEPRIADLFREGGWLTVSNVVGPMMVTFDRFAIAAIVSLAAASYYFVPQEMSLRMLVIPGAIATTIFPMLARSGRDGHGHRRIAQGALLAVTASCLPLCAVIGALAEPLLSAWMGSAFAQASAQVAGCLAVGLFANCCAQVPFAWIQAAGRSDVTGKLHLIQLPVYAALLLILTMRFGIVGTAVAWSVRATADAILLYYASASLFPEVDLKMSVIPIVMGLLLLTLLGATPLVADGTLRWTVAGGLFGCSIAIAAFLAWRLAQDFRR